ncbi:MAG TPA: molybdopterin cofactor-binding domain-containing protein [Caulifigura sp.]|jgi:isoquinoline 1-oxidoreductase|nr:molybdopterin cofactor-binding domain-containing protein [Caulifigura sp.]
MNDPIPDDIELERYELREDPRYRFGANRREFVQILGAGLVVAVAVDPSGAQDNRRRGGGAQRPRRDERLSERFHLGEDGVVTVLTSKVEVGQGARTQITQAVAEELRLPLDRIRLVMADTGQCPDDGGTAGSRTTPSTVPRVRTAAAFLRNQLSGLAAQRLKVEQGTVTFSDGRFSANGNGSVTLVELLRVPEFGQQLNAALPDQVAVEPAETWRVLGKPVAKVTGREVVTGQAKYPSDIARPGMLYGRVLRPASYGAKLESIDLAPAQSIAGVTVVRDGDFVGCAATSSWLAKQAVEALARAAKWTSPSHPSSERLPEHLKSTARRGRDAATQPDQVPAKTLDTAYSVAYIQHAPMEPRAAVAEWTDGKLTVWTGSQQPSRVQSDLTQAFRISADQVRVIVPDTGGGFGGKHTGEAAVEAARLAKAAGTPVSLRWTREEEFTWAYFRPAGLIEVRAGLDGDGKISVWSFLNYNSGGSALQTPYNVARKAEQVVECDAPLRQGSYRALASTANTFARESAMDELAKLAGRDPFEFRLAHLPDGRLKDVLLAATKKFEWKARRERHAGNRGVGLACGTEKGSFVAACAEVEVKDGRIRVLSVTQAYECGAIQNPLNLRLQVEGAMVMGLGGALTEEMRFENGRILNANFADYHVPRMDDVPALDIELVDRRDLPSVGAGETPIIAIAPAIANAIEHAVGVRCRSMPLKLS